MQIRMAYVFLFTSTFDYMNRFARNDDKLYIYNTTLSYSIVVDFKQPLANR